jgi:hypothetical protein
MPKALTGPAAIAALQKQVSPKGVAAADAAARKAIDKKYPGLYIPEVRQMQTYKKVIAKSPDQARAQNKGGM